MLDAIFDQVDLAYYPTENWKAYVGHRYLGGLNAAAFHLGIEKKMVNWDTAPKPPFAARFAGASSMMLWAGVIVFGRFIAYNWYPQLF